MDSGLAWTIAKSPRLVNRPERSTLVAGTDLKLGLFSSIGREELSEFLVGETLRPFYEHKAVFVTN